MLRLPTVALMLILALGPGLHAQSQPNKPFSLKKIEDQWALVRGVPDVFALQKCENWAWAAAVDAILAKENIPLDQKFWIDKLNGGSVCRPTAGPREYLTRVVDGNHTLPDGRRFRLQSKYSEGAPTSTDRLLVPLALGRPYILWWKQHAYVVYGALWNEYIYPNGAKTIEIKEISLLDPYAEDEKHKVKFVVGTDSASDINGMFELTATPIDESPWNR